MAGTGHRSRYPWWGHDGVGRFRPATSVRHVRHDQKEPGPTKSDTGRGSFLLSFGLDRSGYYSVACSTGLIPNETQFPCRTLVACVVRLRLLLLLFEGREYAGMSS